MGGVGLLLGLVICCFAVGIFAYAGGRQEEENYLRSRVGHKVAQQADTDHAGVPALAERLLSNPEPLNDSERENRDLAAQENAAAWAFWMVILTGLQVIVGIAGTYFIVVTLRHGQESLQEARRSNALARYALDAEYRPWVHIVGVEIEQMYGAPGGGSGSLLLSGKVLLENQGRTVATGVTVRWGLAPTMPAAAERFNTPLPSQPFGNLFSNKPASVNLMEISDVHEAVGEAGGTCYLGVEVVYGKSGGEKGFLLREVWVLASQINGDTVVTLGKDALLRGENVQPIAKHMFVSEMK